MSRAPRAAGTPLRRPKLLDTVLVVPATGRLVLRNGARGRTALELSSTEAAAGLLELLDGRREWSDIVAEAHRRHPEATTEELCRIYEQVEAAGLLEDEPLHPPLTEQQLDRYSRNLACYADQVRHLGSKYEVHRRLAASRVLILGVGGLGSGCALGLAMLGVGSLVLVDFDDVEVQNLNRQVLYDTAAIGEPKAPAAAERLRAVNPEPEYTCRSLRLESGDHVAQLLHEYEPGIVVLGADRPWLAVDRYTSQACEQSGTPYTTGTVNGGFGAVWSRVPGRTSCEECRLRWLETTSLAEYEVVAKREREDLMCATSALGVGAQIISGLIGLEVLHCLLGAPMPSAGHRITVDFGDLSLDRVAEPVHPRCTCRAAEEGRRR
ncbi:HesA/MoeB/ThiF family protein [Streptomyces sp. NPDC018045]|uniref:HesA/MoeB/ThiF family protein n=1 Tax=Streptomyces sp. NPDC018045 TaxID=3365037 RepID=UPI00379174CF